jgi:hypothetical protein
VIKIAPVTKGVTRRVTVTPGVTVTAPVTRPDVTADVTESFGGKCCPVCGKPVGVSGAERVRRWRARRKGGVS